ncbi:tetratricopeptide repeat-containing protein [Cystoisospora suis]|uniref:Tetratricopeptide repeat-containing protein n=1 Tax=Cystoisospora suis TaxID=483139 RepID=A0A2C6LI02_9APIC|nr:tetratricopeptide repeat-containing protein [Cystoisospora suis]
MKKVRRGRGEGGKKRREGSRRDAEDKFLSPSSVRNRSAVTAEVLQDSSSLSSSSLSSSSATTNLSPSFFLQKAESCLQTFPPNFALSLRFLLKGVSVHPNNVTLLVRTAEALCEEGRLEEAKELLQRAIQIEPEGGDAGKYFCLAQIEEGEESLLLFQKASSLLSSKLSHLEASINSVKDVAGAAQAAETKKENSSPSSATTASLRILEKEYREVSRQLVESKCSMAELYMTDLCELDQAESLCKKEIDEAVEIMEKKCNDSSSSSYIDALYLQASFRKTTGDIAGAKDVGLKATRLIHEQLKRQENNLRIVPSKKAESSSSFLREEEEEEDVCSRELRINLSRVLIDVEEAESAAFLLSSCLEEDDGDPDIWLVLGCALFKCDKLGEAEECLERLTQLVHASERTSKSSKKKNPQQQNPLLLHAQELLRRIQEEKKKRIEAGELCEKGEEENNEEEDDEANWEDEDEDDEDVDMAES